MSDDPYLYPGTETLKNRFGVQDPKALSKIERTVTAARMREPMKAQPALTPQGFQQTHKHIFRDVYPWAGTIRTVRMDKGGSRFCMPQHIDAQMRMTFAELQKEQGLRGLDPDAFAERAAFHIAELNAILSVPRRQWPRATPVLATDGPSSRTCVRSDADRSETWMDGSIRSFREGPKGDHSRMAETIREALIQQGIRVRTQGDRARTQTKAKSDRSKTTPATKTEPRSAEKTPSPPSRSTSPASRPETSKPVEQSESAQLRAEFAEMKAQRAGTGSEHDGGRSPTSSPAKGPSLSR